MSRSRGRKRSCGTLRSAAVSDEDQRRRALEAALFRCVELTGEDTSGGVPGRPTLPEWAVENVARLRAEADAADEVIATLWICSWGHVSNTARFPNAAGVRRCFFCSQTVSRL